jgi:NTE family protein
MNILFRNIRNGLATGYAGLMLTGCATHGVIHNTQQTSVVNPDNYSLIDQQHQKDGNLVVLALSGGGTRAASFSYGVLQELRDTTITNSSGEAVCLLDTIDAISSVSGGSFVAAYYGLFGDRIFENFEQDFLRKNIQGHLIRNMYNPLQWFNSAGRVEQAVKYYQKILFGDATYADLKRKDGPLILINASDLSGGVRFTFVQEYFNLLGSDIASFPVAEAVTASSAVPILFDPVVVQNYPSPHLLENSPWLAGLNERAEAGHNSDVEMLKKSMNSYADKENRRFIHFVDGGLTDNLGLRAIYDIIEINGGIETFTNPSSETTAAADQAPPPIKRIIVILVNAATHRERTMDRENEQPSLQETISAASSLQMIRYSEATLSLMENSLKQWAEELSTPEQPVTSHFIHVRFEDAKDPLALKVFNALPTSFNLPGNQINDLIKGGRTLLRNNPDFQELLREVANREK